MRSPLNKLTDRSRSVMQCAAYAAKRAKEPDVSPSHLLHGLAFEREGIAAHVLENMGWKAIDDEQKYELGGDVLDLSGSQFLATTAEVAYREAIALEHRYVGTEHLLLALVRTHPQLFVDPDAIRREVLSILGHLP